MSRIRLSTLILAAVVFVTTWTVPLEAQPFGIDTAEMLSIAVRAAEAHAPRGRNALGFADTVRVGPAVREETARRASIASESLATARVCTSGGERAPGCLHLVGVNVFIEVTGISFSGDTAHVFMTIADETKSTRQPIHYEWVEVMIEGRGAAWRTVALRLLAET